MRVLLLPAEREEAVRRGVRRKKIAKAVAVVLVLVVAFTLFFAIVLNVNSLGVGRGNTDGKFGTVLADIEGITDADPRIIDIAMLGAHDANTASLEPGNPIDDNPKSDVFEQLYPVSAGFQYRMSVTQTVSPHELLMQGVRFVHFKYTYYDNDWYASHSIIGRKFEEDVKDVLRFLADHRGEVVVLLLQSTWFGEDQSLHTFHDWLAGVTLDGKNIYDYVHYDKVNVFDSEFAEEGRVRMRDLRYNAVTESGTSAGVVLLDRREWDIPQAETEKSAHSDYFFDVDSTLAHQWHSRMGEDVLTEEIDDYVFEVRAQSLYRWKLRVNQTQASLSVESVGDVLRDIGAWSLVKFAEDYNLSLLENEDFDEWLRVLPVFQVDFANSDKGDFNRRVNEKIRARNEEIVRTLIAENGNYEKLY